MSLFPNTRKAISERNALLKRLKAFADSPSQELRDIHSAFTLLSDRISALENQLVQVAKDRKK